MIERELGNWKDFIEVMLRKIISGNVNLRAVFFQSP
ncbi:Uncharacterised protein [Kluyvera cryocrescens]|nr:Uncharacterised protein [Kluyvera cryocrescens]